MTRRDTAPSLTGFAHLLHAEWIKFRTVRGWVIAIVAGLVAIVFLGWFSASGSHCLIQGPQHPVALACPSPPVGPGGEFVTDDFYLVRRALAGNGSITVRVTSLTGRYNPNGQVPRGEQDNPMAGMEPGVQPWAKAGIIITDGTRQGSAYAAMMVTGGYGVRMQWDYTQDSPGLAGRVSAASPRWLRLTRSGERITGYDSADGTRWVKVGTATLPGLPPTVQAGMFATSPGNSQLSTQSIGAATAQGGPTVATAAFDRVSLDGSWLGRTWAGEIIAASDAVVIRQAETFHLADGTIIVTGSGDIAPAGPVSNPGATVGAPLVGTFAGLIAAVVVGTMFMTAEYRRGLIRLTFAASPRRGQVLAAKAIVIGAVTFTTGLAAAAVTIPIGLRVLHSNGSPINPVSASAALQVIAGTAALLAIAAVLALAVGAVARRSAVAVGLGIVVIVLPYLLGTSPGVLSVSAQEWLLRVTPAAAFAIQQTNPVYPRLPAFDAAQYVPSNGYFPLGPWAGLAVLCGYAALAVGLAAFLLWRRDA
jgi:ABC-type transport system involved in multi-copper enzyme maturation permease subunit